MSNDDALKAQNAPTDPTDQATSGTGTPLLVDAAWLAEHREDEGLRIVDATTFLEQPEGDGYYTVSSGRQAYEREHIPGAVFADLLTEFADTDAPGHFTALDSDTFAERMGALGVGDGSHVVIYDQGINMWATRLWWNLRLEGFDSVSVLDGGLPAWKDAGQPVASGSESLPAARFTAHRRPELYADRDRVLAAIEDDSQLLINVLDEDTFTGRRLTYDRAGHIPSSVNVPFQGALTPESRLVSVEDARELFAESGALDDSRQPITYCGGGIAATLMAFELARLGRDDVAVYDGSMTEWAADESLPLQTGS